jgi:hypothetical protein
MTKTLIDPADVTRAGLLRDQGWYDACWWGDRAERRPRLLTRLIDQVLTAARVCRSATCVAQDAPAVPRSAPNLMATDKPWQSVPL